MTGGARRAGWPPREGWNAYLAAYHEAHAGITEDLLASARDGAGRSPYEWLLEAVPAHGTVVDLACGSARVVRRLGGRRALGVDRSAGELARARGASPGARLVRADAGALPLAPATADAVTASMALMVLDPLAAVLAEVARVLRAGGRLVATVPTRRASDGDDPDSASLFTEILVRLGQARTPYPEPLDPASAPGRLAAAGFRLVEDAAALFVRPVGDEADAELAVRSFYAPGATAAQVSAAVEVLRERVRGGGAELAYRIRRLVAVAAGPPLAGPPLPREGSAKRVVAGQESAAGLSPMRAPHESSTATPESQPCSNLLSGSCPSLAKG